MKRSKTPLPGAVLLLAALGFVLGTGEFVIVGILPEIAEGLGTSLAAVGKLVSVFAACYAVGTPVITAACGGVSRKKLLAVLMGVFLLTGAVSFAAPNVAVLYAARVAAAPGVRHTDGGGHALRQGGGRPGGRLPGRSPWCMGAFLWRRCWGCPWAPPCASGLAGGGPLR